MVKHNEKRKKFTVIFFTSIKENGWKIEKIDAQLRKSASFEEI